MSAGAGGMSGRRLATLLVLAVLLLNGLVLLTRQLAPEPEGRQGSSLATQPLGVRAYADLLERRGHPVRRLREEPRDALPDPRTTTVVVIEPDQEIANADAAALARFVARGGRLVAAGRRLLPLHDALDGPGPSVPRGEQPPAPVRHGRGEAFLLTTAAPLRNRALDQGGNAALALRLAGDDDRRRLVAFVESVHGLTPRTGLAALPDRWKALLAGLALAAATLLWSRIRRFGPPERAARDLPPPRREYVDALAATLRRTKDPDGATRNLRAEARRLVAVRAGLPPDASERDVQAAAERLGLPPAEVAALADRPDGQDAPLAGAGALARLRKDT